MCDVILVVPLHSMGFGNTVNESPTSFSIRYARLKSTDDLATLLSGQPLSRLPDDSIILEGEVRGPSGQPADELSIGSPTNGTIDEARAVLANALRNSQSVLNINGFSSATPVYFWRPGQEAIAQ